MMGEKRARPLRTSAVTGLVFVVLGVLQTVFGEMPAWGPITGGLVVIVVAAFLELRRRRAGGGEERTP